MERINELTAAVHMIGEYLTLKGKLDDFEVAPVATMLELIADSIGREVNN